MKLSLFLLLLSIQFSCFAETFAKYQVKIERIQRTSELFPTDPSVANVTRFYVSESPAWTGGNCDRWIMLQSNDEISLSLALAAFASGKEVDVIVDDSLLRHNNSCTLVRFSIRE